MSEWHASKRRRFDLRSFGFSKLKWSSVLLAVLAPCVLAQGSGGPEDFTEEEREAIARGVNVSEAYQEYGQRLRSAQEVSPLSSEVFGESVNRVDEYPDGRAVRVDLRDGGKQGLFYDWKLQ